MFDIRLLVLFLGSPVTEESVSMSLLSSFLCFFYSIMSFSRTSWLKVKDEHRKITEINNH
jgi:hypothetical protein